MQKGVLRKRNPSPLSEYGRQLKEKQTLKREYHLRERQFRNYVEEALERQTAGRNAPELFIRRLEMRLDNAVFRAGLAQTRLQARQLVSHGHILLNGKKVTVSSCMVKKGDAIAVHASFKKSTLCEAIKLQLKKYQPPSWLALNHDALEIKVTENPSLQEVAPSAEIPVIFDFYSR